MMEEYTLFNFQN